MLLQDDLPWHNWELREYIWRVTYEDKDRRVGKQVDVFSEVEQMNRVLRSNRALIDWTEDDVRSLRRIEFLTGITSVEPELFQYYIPRPSSTFTPAHVIFDGNPGSSAAVDITDLQDVVWESERSASPDPFTFLNQERSEE